MSTEITTFGSGRAKCQFKYGFLCRISLLIVGNSV